MDNEISPEQKSGIFSNQVLEIATEEDYRRLYIDCTWPSGLFKPGKEKEFLGFEKDHARRVFWNVLAATIPNIGFEPPQGRKLELLELGCGRAESAVVLNAYFSGNEFGHESNKVNYVGIDINATELELGKNIILEDSVFSNQYKLIEGDAANPLIYEGLISPDVIVIRNQEMLPQPHHQNRRTWEQIISRGFSKVRDSGIVIITSPFPYQRELIEPVLNKLQAQILFDGATSPQTPDNSISEWDTIVTVCRTSR